MNDSFKLAHQPDGSIYDPINDIDERNFPSDKLAPDFPPPFFQYSVVSVNDAQATGNPVDEVTYLTIGGGVGSFIWVDNLIIRGVPKSEIASIGMEEKPYGRYQRLCHQSQIPDSERLRSDSGSTPDNVWGWPGYAVREVLTDIRDGDIGHAFKVMGKIFSEPIFSDSYTPISGRVYESMEREAQRIGWYDVARLGRVLAIRKTDDSRYIAAYAVREGDDYSYRFIVGQYLHVAVGYPAVRLLPDLQDYRHDEHQVEHVVNSYEDHAYVYEQLAEKGGSVLVRGRGIVSSRIIQSIYEARQKNPNISVIHLMRRPLQAPSDYLGNQRVLEHNWEIQPYNFPKASWGGNFRHIMENTPPEERPALIQRWGGTTTSDRRDWRAIIDEGMSKGWYQIVFGSASDIVAEDNEQVSVLVRRKGDPMQAVFTVDYVIDATGLDANLKRSPILADLIDTFDLPLNPMHRLSVDQTFELRDLRQASGRAYAVGAPTMGSYFAPVDSFLGLQYAAQVSIEDMIRAGAPHLESLDVYHSTSQWLRWAMGAKP